MRVLFLSWLAVMFVTPVYAETFSGTCSIRFEGASFLGDFDGEGACLPFDVEISKPDSHGRRTVKPWEILIPVEGMETGFQPRDKSMYRMFESEKFPNIRGGLGKFDPDALLATLRNTPESARFDFALTMHGEQKSVVATVRRFNETKERLQIVFSFVAELEAHGMRRPTLMGVPLVGETITIEVATELLRIE